MKTRLLFLWLYFLLALSVRAQVIPRPNIPGPQGLSVNSYTGNLFYQRNEQSLRGTGYRIYQTFYYNSAQDTLNEGYGRGWSFYYHISYRALGDTVFIQRADARKDTFLLRSGRYQAPAGVYETLTKNGNQFILTAKNGEQRIFGDATHRKLTRIQDVNGNFITIDYTNGNPIKITNSSGRFLLLTWTNGLLTQAVNGTDPSKKFTYSYSSSKELIAVTDPLQGRKSFVYSNHYLVRLGDENNNPVVIYYVGTGGRVKQITSCNTEQRFTFLDTERKSFVSQKTESGNSVISYGFDTAGRLSMLTDPNGNKAEFTYDNRNNLITQKDFNGTVSRFTYDEKGNLITLIDPTGNATEYGYESVFNNLNSLKDAKGRMTTLNYDVKGNLTGIVQPGGLTSAFTYDNAGRRLTSTNANNGTTSYQYNADGDLTKIQLPIGNIQFQYNGNCCNVSRITDANGTTLEMTYDLLNRTKTVKDAQGHTVSYDYDAVGNVLKEIDPNGNSKEYSYDGLNRLIRVKLPVGTWSYDYDGLGNLLKMTDANGHITKYTYDKNSQLIKETDPLGHSVGYSYDVNGNLSKRSDPNGNVVNYKYDGLNRLIEKSYNEDTDKYSYDEVGNLVSAYNKNIAYNFEYDDLNRLLKKNILTWNKSLAYTYDAIGNRKTMTNHDGGLTTYSYDSNNRLIKLTNPANLTTTFDYDAGGRIKKQTNGNGTFSTYHYDLAGRLDSLINWKNSTEKISFFYYTFDQYGNRKTMQDKRGMNTYTYDAAYRLVNVAYSDGNTENFTIDGTGNRTQRTKNGVATNYTYNAADQIQTAGPRSFTIDINGNTIGQNDSSQRTYKYDGENRLSEVMIKPQRKVQYKYDPFGDKIEKQDTLSVITRMIYDGDNMLGELSIDNTTQSLYTTSIGMDSWLSIQIDGNNYFYHKDGLNSIVEISNQNALISSQYNYDVYGNLILQNSTVDNSVLYTGRLFDSLTKLFDFRNRFYSPEIGRFINKDDVWGDQIVPLSLNRYNYVENSPVNYIDNTGESKYDPKGFNISGDNVLKVIKNIAKVTGEKGIEKATKIAEKIKKINDSVRESTKEVRNAVDEHDKGINDRYKQDPNNRDFERDYINQFDHKKNEGEASVADLLRCIAQGAVQKYFNAPSNAKDCLYPPGGNGKNEKPNLDRLKNPIVGVTPQISYDPNELVGPAGYDSLKWVSIKQTLPYKVLFENDPDFATAPAQKVTIYVPIHPKLNPASLRLSEFGFGNFSFDVPENTSIYSNRLDVRDSLGVFVDITAGLDIENRRAFWVLQSIDPATGLAATLPVNKGFLPVNDSISHKGEGYVTFTLQSLSSAQTRDTVTAQATIIFDAEESIKTNKWVNTVDAVPPFSNINALATLVDSVFTISWVGQDDPTGSGLKDYVLYVSKNNGPFTLYKDNLTTTTEQLTGEPGTTLSFYTRAADNSGNQETAKLVGDRIVTIKVPTTSSVVCPSASINLSATDAGSGATYQWQVNSGSGFVNISNNAIYSGASSVQLTINSAPSTYSGYQYRCQITIGGNVSYSPVRKLKFSSSWLGIAGESWHNPANWSCGIVPDEFTNVIIPGDVPFKPVLNTNGTCSSLMMVKQGGIVFKESVKLNLTGK
ncbi:hypothetical protein GCM10028805_41840 [Spirosoma harenae]